MKIGSLPVLFLKRKNKMRLFSMKNSFLVPKGGPFGTKTIAMFYDPFINFIGAFLEKLSAI